MLGLHITEERISYLLQKQKEQNEVKMKQFQSTTGNAQTTEKFDWPKKRCFNFVNRGILLSFVLLCRCIYRGWSVWKDTVYYLYMKKAKLKMRLQRINKSMETENFLITLRKREGKMGGILGVKNCMNERDMSC